MSSEIRIGVLTTLFGPFAELGKDGLRGVQLAIREFGNRIGDQKITHFVEGTIGDPETAKEKARKLIDKDRVDFIVGPLSGTEGLGICQYAVSQPNKTFLNGSSGAQNLTDYAPNMYNFAPTGTQCVVGLGRYAYETLKYRKIVTLAEDYSYPYAQLGTFTLEFCQAGGEIIEKRWVPVMTSDYHKFIEAIPKEADAILVALGGTDLINFVKQYSNIVSPKPIIGGAIAVDQSVLSDHSAEKEFLQGIVSCGPTADDNPSPEWHDFVTAYRTQFPDGFNFPSYFALCYYLNTKAALLALDYVEGDLSNNQGRFKEALQTIEYHGPSGIVCLDHDRQVICDSFIVSVSKDENGLYYRKMVKKISAVSQTLGLSAQVYRNLGIFDKNNPSC